MKNYYAINNNTMYIITETFHDKNQSLVREVNGDEYLINKSSNKLMEENCQRFSSNYLHRKAMTKDMTNIRSKQPIMVDFFGSYIYFPLYSDRNPYNLWFNIRYITSYIKEQDITRVIFQNGEELVIDVSYYQFDKQYSNAMKLYYKINLKREQFYEENSRKDRHIFSTRETLLMDDYKRSEYLNYMQHLDYSSY